MATLPPLVVDNQDTAGVVPVLSRPAERSVRGVVGIGFPAMVLDMTGYSAFTITFTNSVDAVAVKVEASNDGLSYGQIQMYCMSGKPGRPSPNGFYIFGNETYSSNRIGRFVRITQLTTGALSGVTVSLFNGKISECQAGLDSQSAYAWNYVSPVSTGIIDSTPVSIASVPVGSNNSQRQALTNAITSIYLTNEGAAGTQVTIRTINASPIILFDAYLPANGGIINKTFSPVLKGVMGNALELILSASSGAVVRANILGIQIITSLQA